MDTLRHQYRCSAPAKCHPAIVTVVKALAVVALSVNTGGLLACADEHVTVRTTPRWHQVATAQPGGATTTVTTGWRKIDGWEHSVLDKDPSLGHWGWYGMQEMNKAYKHWAPGQVVQVTRDKNPSHYVKPNHVPTPVQPPHHAPSKVAEVQPNRGGQYIKPNHIPSPIEALGGKYVKPNHISSPIEVLGGKYVKPNHIPTLVPVVTTNTAVKLAAPRTNLSFNVPAKPENKTGVHGVLSLPGSSESSSLSGKLARPRMSPPILRTANSALPASGPSAGGARRHEQNRGTSDGDAQVPGSRVPDTGTAGSAVSGGRAGLPGHAASPDSFSGDPHAQASDDFSQPDPYAHNPYGLVRVQSDSRSGSKTAVKAKLLRYPASH